MGRPGVPSWVDAAGDHDETRSGSAHPSAAPDDYTAGPIGGSSRAQAALSRALAYLLWGGIALALVLGLVNLAGGSRAAAPAPAADQEPPLPVPPPGGCAELVVAGWLAGDTTLLTGVPGLPRSPPEPDRRRAVRTYTAAATPGEGAWGLLVGADVEVRGVDDGWQAAGTQFFRVTMVPSRSGCQGWSPATLPAQVPAPQLAGDAAPPYPVSLPTSGTDLSQTLAAFFAGLLTGSGDMERYVAPGVVIPAVAPPPYQQVSVTELRARTEPDDPPADGTVVSLLVTVTADPEDLPLVYPVTVAVRDDRWELVAVDPLVGATNGG